MASAQRTGDGMTDIAVRQGASLPAPAEAGRYFQLAKQIANTEFVPGAYRGKPETILAAILYGRELGLAPMESLSEIYMVDGKPTLSAKSMVKRARQAGHSITGDATDQRAVVKGKRSDTGDEMTVTYTLEMAKRAGLAGKKNWKENPEDMLWARAVSRLCRRLFGDVFGSLPYGPEEMEPGPHDDVYAATEGLPVVDVSDEALTDDPQDPTVIEVTDVVDAGDALFEIPSSARNPETGE